MQYVFPSDAYFPPNILATPAGRVPTPSNSLSSARRPLFTLSTTHSADTYRTARVPPRAISFCSLPAASPPPAPRPTMTCVTLRRAGARAMEPPCSTRRCLSLWSEMSGAVEPLM